MSGIDFARVFESSPALAVLLDPAADFRIVAATDPYLRATATERADIIGRGLFDVFTDDGDPAKAASLAEVRASLRRVVTEGVTDRLDVLRYDIDIPGRARGEARERYWVPVNAPVFAPTGEILYVIHQVEDASALVRIRQVEQRERTRLIESNQQFQAVYDQGLFAGRCDLDGVVVDVNRSSLEQCGYVREDVIGKRFWDCGWWSRCAEVQAWVRNGVLRAVQGEVFRGVSAYFWADGTERVVDFACMPIKDETGVVQFVVPTGMDITERVRAEREVRATEILESIPDGYFSLDRQWRFSYVNAAAQRLLERTTRDVLGRVIWEAFEGIDASEFAPVLRRAMNERVVSSAMARYPAGHRFYEVHVYPVPDGISVYFRDVTGENEAADARAALVAASEQQRRIYETALSNTPDLVYVFDLDHRFSYANEALLRMWGRTREDALGKTCLELGYEPWHAAMHDREIDEVIAARRPIRGEVPFTGTNGRRVYEYIFVPALGPQGDVVAVAGTTRDVTERQQVEQAIREQAQRLAEADRVKNEFLATLSHELRNPLTPLRNSLTLLRVVPNADPAVTPIHEMMERQVDHLVRLVDDLLEMSRVSRGEFALRRERVDIGTVVRHAIETSEPLVRAHRHQLSVTVPDTPVTLDGDAVRLAQILANLINNATKYTDAGGRIDVKAWRDGGFACISVRDNGVGIAADALPRMFEMFSRGEGAGRRDQSGLGIGLALSRRLAEMHGGSLEGCSDGPGTGSEFVLRIPLVDAPPPAAPGRVAPATLPRAMRILVVDDNHDAADSLGMVLRALGADVRIANDGPAALAAFASDTPEIVLLDIGMPGMDGYEVARALRARFPGRTASLVALTGWGQDDDRRRTAAAGFDHHLVKPADIGTLHALLLAIDHAAQVSQPAD